MIRLITISQYRLHVMQITSIKTNKFVDNKIRNFNLCSETMR